MPSQAIPKKPTNLSLDPMLLQEARALRVNVSQAAEQGLRHAVAVAKAAAWKQANAVAIAGSNDWVARNGLPLDKYRQF